MRRFLCLGAVFALLQADFALARIGTQYQLALGNPTDAKSDTLCKTNYLVKRAEYALSYNSVRQQPNWVSWSFTTDDRGSSGRSDNFTEDKTLPSGFARLDGSTFGGGFDRGHMCPSADRTLSVQHNEVTFIMSNIAPQAGGNNRGPWNDFEQYCRELASGGQEVLIMCGPSGFKGDKTGAGIPIAEAFWKIALVRKEGGTITSSSRIIAVSMPNKNEIQGTSWTDYITSVEEIERDTGYKFFDTISTSTASNLKVVVDKSATGKRKGIEKEGATAIASAETKEEPKPEPAPVVAQAPLPPPVTLPDSQSIVIFRKSDQGPIESKIAKAKRDGDAVEIVGEDGKLLLLGSRLVLAIAPLPPSAEIQLTKEQVELALSRYDRAAKTDELKTLLADGRAKWTAIKATLEAPVVAAAEPQPANELDVPTAAGVEEPEPVVVKVEAKPETGWRVWLKRFLGWVQSIKENATIHDPESMFKLGQKYFYDDKNPANKKQAFNWYKKAADKGHQESINAVGTSYLYGSGVERNQNEGVKWFRKSAESGNSLGQRNLGWCYLYGIGVKADEKEAMILIQKSANQGNESGIRLLQAITKEKNQIGLDTKITANTDDELRAELSRIQLALPPEISKEFNKAFDSIMDAEWEKFKQMEWAQTPVGAISGLSVAEVIEKGKAIDAENEKKQGRHEKAGSENLPIDPGIMDLTEDKQK